MMRSVLKLPLLITSLVSLLAGQALVAPLRAQEQVDVALVLAVDVSRSMSYEEIQIQRDGYAAAIASKDVVRAIETGAYGRIALSMFEWAGSFHAREILDWTVIENADDARRVAAYILEGRSTGKRRTSISGAIRHGAGLFDELPFVAERWVIDISGDGPNNQGGAVTDARDVALEQGIVINGLPLMTESGFGSRFGIEDLDEYYRRCVIGGPGSFMIPVNSWDQFPEAVRRKLVLEIGNFLKTEPRVIPAQFTFEPPYDCLIGEKIWEEQRRHFWLDP